MPWGRIVALTYSDASFELDHGDLQRHEMPVVVGWRIDCEEPDCVAVACERLSDGTYRGITHIWAKNVEHEEVLR